MTTEGEQHSDSSLPLLLRQSVSLSRNTAWLVFGIGTFTSLVAFITGAGLDVTVVIFVMPVILALGFVWATWRLSRGRRNGVSVILLFTVLLTALTVGHWFMVAPLICAWRASVKAWKWSRTTSPTNVA